MSGTGVAFRGGTPESRGPPVWPATLQAATVLSARLERGYDVSFFPGQLARDPAEPLDGQDNDGNGVVDDVIGPTYDLQLRLRDGSMTPPSRSLQARRASQVAFDKGELDLRFGMNTSEPRQFASFARSASVKEQGDEFLGYLENRGRVHGITCTSKIADVPEFVRLYNNAALPWGRCRR